MEMDFDSFIPDLKIPLNVEEIKALIELANDVNLKHIDAVRILLSIVDVAQWTVKVSGAANYLLSIQWQPAEWYKKLIRTLSYVCKPVRVLKHIRVDQPDIIPSLLPTSATAAHAIQAGPSNVASKSSRAPVIVKPYNSPAIPPNFNFLPGMLQFLAQSDCRLFGVQLEKN
ncbi:hypothetical protein C8J56DRAFT_1068531 [Mycena floridula]|nr:hypothetical protein C8J56DRAFT_1068531 [Mycena floridula]